MTSRALAAPLFLRVSTNRKSMMFSASMGASSLSSTLKASYLHQLSISLITAFLSSFCSGPVSFLKFTSTVCFRIMLAGSTLCYAKAIFYSSSWRRTVDFQQIGLETLEAVPSLWGRYDVDDDSHKKLIGINFLLAGDPNHRRWQQAMARIRHLYTWGDCQEDKIVQCGVNIHAIGKYSVWSRPRRPLRYKSCRSGTASGGTLRTPSRSARSRRPADYVENAFG